MSWMKEVKSWARRGGLAAVMLAAVITAGTRSAAAADLAPIRIGVMPTIESGPLYIAAANGYFKEEGLDAELKFFDTDAQLRRAAAAGKVDVALADLDAALFADAAKHGFKFIASQASDQSGYPTDALLIGKKPHDAGFRSVKDLPGKRVALTLPGSGEQYSLMRIAHRYGIDPSGLKLVWLKTPAQEIAALSRGEVDAAALPFATVLKLYDAGKRGGVIRLSDLAQRQRGVVFVRAEAIEADRSRIEKFVRAYRRGVAEYDMTFQQRGDEGDVLPGPRFGEYLHLIAERTKLSPDLLKYALAYCDHLARLDLTDIDRQLAFWQSQGMVDRRVAAADLLDLGFIGEHIRLPPDSN
jgi:NitT/TauT family transport system substrate-binding protein